MASAPPKIFISWSGAHAKTVAGLLKDWLSEAYQRIDIFYSDDSIDKGDRSLAKIESELNDCIAAIVVVTPESLKSEWVNFEAGALSALKLEDGRPRLVIPLLVGVDRITDVTGPLTQFQAVLLTEDDLTKMVRSLNRIMDIPESHAEKIMANARPELDKIMKSAAVTKVKKAPTRTDSEMLEEILIAVRTIIKQSDSTKPSTSMTNASFRNLTRDIGEILKGVDPWNYNVIRDGDHARVIFERNTPPNEFLMAKNLLEPWQTVELKEVPESA